MGRPWEYPRWRRILMQVVMWLVFAGSLCLARVLAHSRSQDRTNVVRAGIFELRVPEEFKIDSSGPNNDLLAHDTQRSRRLRIQSLPPGEGGVSVFASGEGFGKIKFRSLGLTGVLEAQQRTTRTDEGDTNVLQLRATAVIPNVRTVVITLDDLSPEDPEEDKILIEYFAADLRIARKAGRTTSNPSSDDSDSEKTTDSSGPYYPLSEHP